MGSTTPFVDTEPEPHTIDCRLCNEPKDDSYWEHRVLPHTPDRDSFVCDSCLEERDEAHNSLTTNMSLSEFV